MSEALARRFYKCAVATDDNGVALDARTLRTPGRAVFRAPTRALAEAVAAEWAAQGEHIVPASMPLTQLAFAAIDVTPKRRAELAREIAKYGETDLICHRAETPAALVERQTALWDPLVAWAEERFHRRLDVVTGVIAADIDAQQLTAFEWEVDDLDDFRATALAQAVSVSGSIYIGFALLEGRLTAAEAFAVATVDEAWGLEKWGEDAEARARLEKGESDFHNVGRFIAALG